MSREVMQKALEALENADFIIDMADEHYAIDQEDRTKSIEALRQALAQPEQVCRTDGRCQYAIDHGAEGLGHCPKGKCCMPQDEQEPVAKVVLTEIIGLPVLRWLSLDRQFDFKGGELLYIVPTKQEEGCSNCAKKASDGWALMCVECAEKALKREWVSLTDEEIDTAWRVVDYTESYGKFRISVTRSIEAKLKEKNT